MLGKLLKYETKATARIFLPLYGGLLLLSLINHFFLAIDMGDNLRGAPRNVVVTVSVIAMVLYSFLIMGIFALTMFVMIQRFYKNLLGDEGYLMFTLPVRPWQHITAKMLVSVLWIVGSVVVVTASAFIMAMSLPDMMDFFSEVWRAYVEVLSAITRVTAIEWLAFIQAVVLFLLSMGCGILLLYASISIGHLWSRHRLLGSFAALLVIWIALMVLATLEGSALDALGLFGGRDWSPDRVQDMYLRTNAGLLVANLNMALVGAASFYTANRVLGRKLNLE